MVRLELRFASSDAAPFPGALLMPRVKAYGDHTSHQACRRLPGVPLCPVNVAGSANGRLFEQPPVAGSEPVATTGGTCGEARDRSGVFLNPNSCMGVRARTSKEGSGSMPHETRVVGIDVAKSKVDACIRSEGLRMAAASTPEGEAELLAWLRANRVSRAVMEASGGYERRWAEALRAAGFEVRVVDPKRIRHFARAAGRLAKNDPIDAETIARFAEAFPDGGAEPHDPAREEIDRLVQARTALKDVEDRIKQQGEHRPPALVVAALRAVARTMRAELRKLDAAIAAKIKARPSLARRAEIIDSVPGLADQTVAGLTAWLPELGHITNEAAAALVGAAPYDDDSGGRKGQRHIKGGRRKLRNLLYMPVMGAATQHNPVLKAYYQRLIARGKEPKVAIIACMRKLIVILNIMLARDETWNPARAAA